MRRCRDFFSLNAVLHLLCGKRFCSFVQTFLSSNSKQALTPKIVTLTLSEPPLYSFLLPCLCTRSSIQFVLHNAVVKIFLVLSSLVAPLLLCFLLQFSSLPFFCPLLLLFSVSLNLTLRKRATSPWILHVSKNSRTADLMQKS